LKVGVFLSGEMMEILLNGKKSRFEDGTRLSTVLDEYKLITNSVVSELNGIITNDDPILKDGDQLEIVTFVGGG
jgi:thiamine biosynthesis protein ThiS